MFMKVWYHWLCFLAKHMLIEHFQSMCLQHTVHHDTATSKQGQDVMTTSCTTSSAGSDTDKNWIKPWGSQRERGSKKGGRNRDGEEGREREEIWVGGEDGGVSRWQMRSSEMSTRLSCGQIKGSTQAFESTAKSSMMVKSGLNFKQYSSLPVSRICSKHYSSLSVQLTLTKHKY